MVSAKIRGEGAAPTRRRSHKALPRSAISPCGRPAPGPNAQCQDSRRGRRSHEAPLPQTAPTKCHIPMWEARPRAECSVPRFAARAPLPQGAAPTGCRSHKPLPRSAISHVGGPPPGRIVSAKIRGEGAAPTGCRSHKPLPQSAISPCGRPAHGPNAQCQDSRRGRRSHKVPLPQGAARTSRGMVVCPLTVSFAIALVSAARARDALRSYGNAPSPYRQGRRSRAPRRFRRKPLDRAQGGPATGAGNGTSCTSRVPPGARQASHRFSIPARRTLR
jgi:hypothetical protein